MAKILVAEDSPTQAIEIQFLLEEAGHVVQMVVDGDQALAEIHKQPPEILLTDMHMPGKNGLELTEEVRASFPDVPVVLMTADGTEDLAVQALARGASIYIPKRLFDENLISTIDGIASMLESRRTRTSVLSALTHSESTYTFKNDREFAAALVSQLEGELQHIDFDDGTGTFRIVTALKEAILNSIDHGNLELDSKLRDDGHGEKFYELAEERLTQEPYCHRTVTVTVRLSPEQLAYVITDQGPGFDPSTLPDPSDPENMLRAHGRGLMLIRSFMDDVVFNDAGNQITLIKYRIDPAQHAPDAKDVLSEKKELRILMAEDSMTNQILGTSLLEREGHTVTIASNGMEAVQMSADQEFDLILMDLEMPQMDGLTATQEIRRREQSSGVSIPIIAMTAHDAQEDIQQCLDAGMQGHIGKPVRTEVLNSVLAKL